MFKFFAILICIAPLRHSVWEDVVALRKGDRIGVVQSSKKRIEGDLIAPRRLLSPLRKMGPSYL